MMLKYTGKEKNIIYKETKTVDLTAFLKKHTSAFVRVFGAAVLCALIGALMLAFRYGFLPYASDGDAFDTVYAFGEAGQNDSD